MEVCKFCFEIEKCSETETDFPDIEKILRICRSFISEVSTRSPLIKNQWICEICLINVKSVVKLKEILEQTEQKIQDIRKLKEHDKFDIKTLHPKVNVLPSEMKEYITICRICLKFISRPQIFLYENNVNVVRHDMLKSMLQYCNLNLNFEISEKPTMCTDCWELLQITYTFKKNYLEVDKKIKAYCQRFKPKNLLINKKVLESINIHFAKRKENVKILPSNKNEKENLKDTVRIKMEHNYINPYSQNSEVKPAISTKTNHAKGHFSAEEGMNLLRIFYFVKETELQGKNRIYWPRIVKTWNLIYPERKLSRKFLKTKFSDIQRQNAHILVIKDEVMERIHNKQTTSEIMSWIAKMKNCLESIYVRPNNLESNAVISIANDQSTTKRENPSENKNIIKLKNKVIAGAHENVPQIRVKSFASDTSTTIHNKEKNSIELNDCGKIFPMGKFITVKLQNLEQIPQKNSRPLTVKEREKIANKIPMIRINDIDQTLGNCSSIFNSIESHTNTDKNYTINKLPHIRPICVERIPPPPLKNPSTIQETSIEKLASGIPALLPVSEENNSDSDDLFEDEATPSSPFIKVELDDSDVEICIDEPKLEVVSYHSDSESLPELERMDIAAPLETGFNTVDDKREALNNVMDHIDTGDPDLNVEEVKTCRRFTFKSQPVSDGLFKCTYCNFETRYRGSADNHAKWHTKKNKRKLYECPECPYKISNKYRLTKHLRLHREENDIPVLLPWTQEFQKP